MERVAIMKLLFITQVVDKNDAVLGAYHGWLGALAPHFETITVICLREGEHTLPPNVHVYSLGKEKGVASRWRYSGRFLKLVWQKRNEYDAVFVHMNQEYLLLAGWLWKLWGKKIYLWRNHYSGSLLTDIAAALCTNVFCTSKFSYTARYKKTMLMPVGIDTTRFEPLSGVAHTPRSILFLARMSPSKRPEILIEALGMLRKRGIDYVADFYGSPLPKDKVYYEGLKERVRVLGIDGQVMFHPGVSNNETPNLYRAHEIFVNTSPSGMLDKTIFEAAACGCLVLSSSRDLATRLSPQFSFAGENPTALIENLTQKLGLLLESSPAKQKVDTRLLQDIVLQNNLSTLIQELTKKISS